MSSHSQTLHSRLFPTNRAASSWRYWGRLLFLIILLGVNSVPAYTASASVVAGSTESTAASRTFMLVAAETIPGNNPDNLTPVLRYEFTDTGALQSLSSIPPYPASTVQDPSFVAFSPQGELFVANRHGNVGNGIGSIARFTLDATHNIVAYGVITGNSVEAVAGLAFSPAGELFAANFANGLVSRFTFDAQGQAIANGTFNTDELYNEALAFSADGELFSTHSSNLIRRWRIDSATRAVTANGIIAVPAASRLHGLAFSADNELFAADPDTNLIFRIRFDASGNATSNGTISASGGALGLAFSPIGELFVTGHFTGGISRFVFDANGLATQNGETIATNSLGGAAILPLPEAAPETDSISFVSDSSWNVYDADPANGSATDLGSAQAV